MGSSDNGIRQSPFSDAWPTPDVGGQGVNGIGGGTSEGTGGNGITQSPFAAAWPTPGTGRTADGIGPAAPDTISLDGSSAAGSLAPWDITSSRNTVDKK